MNTRTRLQEIPSAEAQARDEVHPDRDHDALMSFSIFGPCRVPAPVPVPVPVPDRAPLKRGGFASLIMALAAVATLTASVPAQAIPTDFTADGRLVDVGIRVEGQRAPLFMGPSDMHRFYFEAFEGHNYSVVLRNNTGRRIGVLLAVDGLNVVNGEKSRLRSNEAMYVLNPWGSAEIAGWRTSLRDIRKFVFVDEEQSYAERTGQANGDMGWIRVLAFDEQRTWNEITPDLRYDGRQNSKERERREGDEVAPREAPAPQSAKPEASDRSAAPYAGGQQSVPGTGWGDKGFDPVRRTEFTAARNATDHLVFRYEYASGLRALGIFPQRRGRVWERDNGQLGFAKPPKW
jgi:hypothetical protein